MTTRTNLIPNPSFEVDAAGWSKLGGAGTTAWGRSTSYANVGTASLVVTTGANGTGGTGLSRTATGVSGIPVTAGLDYTASAYFYRVNGASTNVATVGINYYNAAGTYITNSNANVTLTAATTWYRGTLTLTAPAGAVYANVELSMSGVTAFSTYAFDAVLFEQASSAGTYFDGSFTDTPVLDYAWTGTAHQSASTKSDIPPVANFTHVEDFLEATFTDTSTPGGTITGWSWDFDDGTFSALQNPVHTYGAAGTYNVSLTVTNAGGTSTPIVKAVTVTAPPVELVIPGIHARLEVETSPSVWTDITGPTTTMSITYDNDSTGTLSAEVLDADLDPLVSDDLRRGKAVRASAYDYDTDTYGVIYTGTIDNLSVKRYPREARKVGINLTASNAVSGLASKTEPRGVATIDELRWLVTGVDFNINGATTPLGSGTVVSNNDNASIWDEVLLTRDTALGYAWVDKNNVLQVWDADEIDTTVKATIGPDVYADMNADWDGTQVINVVNINWMRYNIGTETSSSVPYGPYADGPSITANGPYTATYTMQGPVEDEAIIEAYADEILSRNATAEYRPQAATVNFHTTDDLTLAHKLDLNSFVDVVFEDGTTTMTMRVTGIKHSLTPDGWSVEYSFAKADSVSAASIPPSTGISTIPDGSIGSDQLDPDVVIDIDTALSDANDAFLAANAAQSTINDWTYTGTTTIDGGEIRTDTIGAVQISANAITSKHTLTGPLIQTTATASRGIKLNSSGFIGYDSGGSTTFYLDATTGAATFKGSILSGSSITGTSFATAASGQRVEMSVATSGYIHFYPPSGSAARITAGTGGELVMLDSAGTSMYLDTSGLHLGSAALTGSLSASTLSISSTAAVTGVLTMGNNINLGGNNITNAGTITVSNIAGAPTFSGNPTWNSTTTGGSANVNWNAGKLQPVTSSERYKTGIENLVIDLDNVYALVPRKYKRIADNTTEIGFIAEEALAAGLDDWVMYNDNGEVESFDYFKYVVALQGAVVDLNARLTALEVS